MAKKDDHSAEREALNELGSDFNVQATVDKGISQLGGGGSSSQADPSGGGSGEEKDKPGEQGQPAGGAIAHEDAPEGATPMKGTIYNRPDEETEEEDEDSGGAPSKEENEKNKPSAGEKPAEGKDKPDESSAGQDDRILKEIFGSQFGTVKELQEADIPGQLRNIQGLKQQIEDLTKKANNPVAAFANDNVALFNEFVKKTGISNFDVFTRIMDNDLEKMDPMDFLILQEVIDSPALIGKESMLKKRFEKSYNLIESDDLPADEVEVNRTKLIADGGKAKNKIMEMKAGVKMPEPSDSSPDSQESDEQRQQREAGWKDVIGKISTSWTKLPLTPRGAKEPVAEYVIPENTKAGLARDAQQFAIQNNLPLTKESFNIVYGMMLNRFVVESLPDLLHTAIEKSNSSTREEKDREFEHPSAELNAARQQEEKPGGEKSGADAAFEAEMRGY